MKVASVNETEADLIEKVMRTMSGGVLDYLTSHEFNSLAREAKKILVDPETRNLYVNDN